MYRKKSFTVTQPPMIMWLALVLMGIFVLILIIEMCTSSPPYTAQVVLATIFIFIPCTLIVLWVKLFRIKLSGTTISVRRFFGIVNFSFDVSEITLVRCKTVKTRMGSNQKITIYTSKGKKIPLETIMINSEKMIGFIEQNVDEMKFETSYKSIV